MPFYHKTCHGCKHIEVIYSEEPCINCTHIKGKLNWESEDGEDDLIE